MSRAPYGERLAALRGITEELTQAECPCGYCMAGGCVQCAQTGTDLESLASIRQMVAKCLEVVSGCRPETLERLIEDLNS